MSSQSLAQYYPLPVFACNRRFFYFRIMEKDLIDTWEIHQRINLYLLDSILEDYLEDIASSKGRNVAEQVAHIHNVRLMWLQAARPDLLAD